MRKYSGEGLAPKPGDLVLTSQTPRSTIRTWTKTGLLHRVKAGVYVAKSPRTALLGEAEVKAALRRSWRAVLTHEVPGPIVVTDRSGMSGAPTGDGELYIVTPGRERRLVIRLPGLTILTRDGAPPDDRDVPLVPERVWGASQARALIENTAPSRRTRNGDLPRTLSETEIGDWIDRIVTGRNGPDNLRYVRTEIDRLAATGRFPGTDPAVPSRLIGAALGTTDADTPSRRLTTRIAGHPYDARRIELFDQFADRLARTSSTVLPPPDPTRSALVPFYEAYFSNVIEGTEFTIDEAFDVVFHGADFARPDDAHDVRGTWQVTSDLNEMSRGATDADEFCELLRLRHRLVMSSRTDNHPGVFKDRANRVGGVDFVAPDAVEETLRIGWAILAKLEDPFHRACFVMFLVAEVHPFLDGNGRVARLFMNAELVGTHQHRIIIPTVYRNNYLAALSGLSNDTNPDALARVLGFAQRWVAAGDWDVRVNAERYLHASNAYREPTAEQAGEARLRIPDPADLHPVDGDDPR